MQDGKIDIILVTNRVIDDESITKQIKDLDWPESELYGEIIVTSQNSSASVNRNYGLNNSESEILVMMDDDITGFYDGWLSDLVEPMFKDNTIIIASARMLKEDGSYGPMMGGNVMPKDKGVFDVVPSGYMNYRRVCTACIAIRKNRIRFDENFIGSGYEDTDYMNSISASYPDKRIVVNNNCKLIHLNEMKNQGGKYWKHNKKYYLSKYPNDHTVIDQTDWTKT